MALLSSLLVALVNYLLFFTMLPFLIWRVLDVVLFLLPVLYLVGVALVYVLTVKVLLVKLNFWGYSGKLISIAPLVTFNTALFGVFFIADSQNFGSVDTIGYAVGSGAGYTIAVLALYYARVRLSLSTVPRAFRGLPVLLIYMGLVSLALSGLTGQRLPT